MPMLPIPLYRTAAHVSAVTACQFAAPIPGAASNSSGTVPPTSVHAAI